MRKKRNENRNGRNERKLCEQLSHVVHLTHFLAFLMPWPWCCCQPRWGHFGVIKQSKKEREMERLPTLLLWLQMSCHAIKLAKWLSLYMRPDSVVLEAKIIITVIRCSITQLHNEADSVCARLRNQCQNQSCEYSMSAWDSLYVHKSSQYIMDEVVHVAEKRERA